MARAMAQRGALLLALVAGCALSQEPEGCAASSCQIGESATIVEVEVDEHAALQTRAGHSHQPSAETAEAFGDREVTDEGISKARGRGAAAGHHAHAGHCLHYAVKVPAFSKYGVPVSEVQVRYTIVDLATVATPTILTRAGETPIPLSYNGYETPTQGNSIYDGFGRGMFSIYYIDRTTKHRLGGGKNFHVMGLWPNCAYMSVSVSYGKERVVYNAETLPTWDAPLAATSAKDATKAPNPFTAGSDTVLAYAGQAKCAGSLGGSLAQTASEKQLSESRPTRSNRSEATGADLAAAGLAPTCEQTNTNVYRLAGSLSNLIGTDGGTDENCSTTYLLAPAKAVGYAFSIPTKSTVPIETSYDFGYGFIKMRVPNTFNNFKDVSFKGLKSPSNPLGYDALAFTISSNWMVLPPNVPFGVNSLMLAEDGFNAQGIAIILFAPPAAVQALVKPGDGLPPVVHLPHLGISAYLLAAPDYAFLLRYRGPSEHHQGSPANVDCNIDLLDALQAPATCQDLGEYLPQITRLYGVSSVAALADRIA